MTADTGKMIRALEDGLVRAGNYGHLIELQDQMLERAETDDLPRLLDRKDRILASLARIREEVETLTSRPGWKTEKNAIRVEQLWKELTGRLEEFSTLEKKSLAQALTLREWLACQLRQIQKGKKLLGNYARAGQVKQARFKDLKS